MTRKYFGTDGIRGRVGDPQMNAEFMLRLGRAAGRVLAPASGGLVVIGKDTRSSGYMFEAALEAGFSAAGVNLRLLGPMPTPAIAYLTRSLRAQAGVVISASHNPYYDNGIKFFSAEGRKLADDVELAIEKELDAEFTTADSAKLGAARRIEDAAGRYTEFCKASVPIGLNLNGMKIVLDCANGATYKIAPVVFSDLGAQVASLGVEPDGLNINRECGSTHPEQLIQKVRATGAQLGIAFDGDGDRVLMVDHTGALVDGDELLYLIALRRREQGALKGPVVGTLMSNLGLEQALLKQKIPFRRAQVGDRHVMAMLEQEGGTLGGENSGHIVCLDRTTTGDGIISALQVLEALHTVGRDLADLKSGMHKYPQTLINVKTAVRVDLDAKAIRSAVHEAERKLGKRGRVLLRASGTEPVVRVMVEGKDMDETHNLAESIVDAVRIVAG